MSESEIAAEKAREILQNWAYDYIHPDHRLTNDPQSVIDHAIKTGDSDHSGGDHREPGTANSIR